MAAAQGVVGDIKEASRESRQVMGRVQKAKYRASREQEAASLHRDRLSREGRSRAGFVRWLEDEDENDGMYGEGDASTGWLPPNTFKVRLLARIVVVARGGAKT